MYANKCVIIIKYTQYNCTAAARFYNVGIVVVSVQCLHSCKIKLSCCIAINIKKNYRNSFSAAGKRIYKGFHTVLLQDRITIIECVHRVGSRVGNYICSIYHIVYYVGIYVYIPKHIVIVLYYFIRIPTRLLRDLVVTCQYNIIVFILSSNSLSGNALCFKIIL